MRIERIQLVEDLSQMINGSSFLYLISYKGLKVEDFEALRGKLREVDAECHVVKNSFIKIAAEKLGMGDFASQTLSGDTAMVVGAGDSCATAKILKEAAKEIEAVDFKSGYLDGKALSVVDMNNLADLPPLEVMRAQLLGVLQAPAGNLVGVLDAKVATIVYALKACLDKRN
jgi:large subunit ribosomal protein L10